MGKHQVEELQVEVKVVPDTNGLYATTSDGRIWCNPRVKKISPGRGFKGTGTYISKGRWIKQFLRDSSGYKRPFVRLTLENGVRKNMQVHRLVALAWIPNPENKPEVNHIDANVLNNNVSNLEWCTRTENQLHSHKMRKQRNNG